MQGELRALTAWFSGGDCFSGVFHAPTIQQGVHIRATLGDELRVDVRLPIDEASHPSPPLPGKRMELPPSAGLRTTKEPGR